MTIFSDWEENVVPWEHIHVYVGYFGLVCKIFVVGLVMWEQVRLVYCEILS